MYVQHTSETKAQAIEMHNTGKSVATISKELNISESTLRHWFLRYSSPEQISEEESANTALGTPPARRFVPTVPD